MPESNETGDLTSGFANELLRERRNREGGLAAGAAAAMQTAAAVAGHASQRALAHTAARMEAQARLEYAAEAIRRYTLVGDLANARAHRKYYNQLRDYLKKLG